MIRYKCLECNHEVTGSAYRATCPECGGMLVDARRRERPR